MMHRSNVYATIGLWATILVTDVAVAASTITRDVIVVGGGASGAHAAIWLRDHNKTVAVIEKRDVLVNIAFQSTYSNKSLYIILLTYLIRVDILLYTTIQTLAKTSMSACKLGWNTRIPQIFPLVWE